MKVMELDFEPSGGSVLEELSRSSSDMDEMDIEDMEYYDPGAITEDDYSYDSATSSDSEASVGYYDDFFHEFGGDDDGDLEEEDNKVPSYCIPINTRKSRLMSAHLPTPNNKHDETPFHIIMEHFQARTHVKCNCLLNQCPEGDQSGMIELITGVRRYLSAHIGNDQNAMYELIKLQLLGR